MHLPCPGDGASTARPCIGCGDCEPACPEGLQPQRLLHWLRLGEDGEAAGRGLLDCNGCGRCDAVCPSAIPLAATLGEARSSHLRRAALMREADAARARHQARAARLQRDAAERAARQAARRQEASSADAVQAALERARARKRRAASPDG